MKFGHTLRDRSIHKWAYHNVDYDDLKRAIKAHTTSPQGRPVFIPGQGNEAKALKDFENALYIQLLKEHTRVDQFVRSKAGELTRRLVQLDKALMQLSQRYPPVDKPRKSVRRMERFSRLEDVAIQIGQELEYLDRFIAVNRQAFHKILKKYRKWTNSLDLEQRFHEHILSRPLSFANKNLTPALVQYNELLAAARAASLSSEPLRSLRYSDASIRQSEAIPGSTSADIQYAYENGSDAELDTALAILPCGSIAGRACYWVHKDSLLQIQVILLRYMRSRKNRICTSGPSPSSSRASRHGSLSSSDPISITQSNQKVGKIVCDELLHFVERQNNCPSTESDNEVLRGSIEPAASIRYSSSGEAVLTIGTSSNETPKANLGSPWKTAKLKRKAIENLLGNDTSCEAPRSMNSADPSEIRSARVQAELHSMPSLTGAKSWLQKHENVRPLVEIHSNRTRFAGTRNTDSSGLWATLDTDIILGKCSSARLRKGDDSSSSGEEAGSPLVAFPHAVLTIRWEGNADMTPIKKLDSSHLTERVHGFSIDVHAVAVIYKPQRMTPPHWLSLLDQDIRRVPNESESNRSGSNGRSTPGSSSRKTTSNSISSTTDLPTDSGFSAKIDSSVSSVPEKIKAPTPGPKQKKRIRRESLRRRIQNQSHGENLRYWNEYDDGDESADDGGYTIVIDPNATSGFPGAASLSRLAEASTNKIKSLFHREKTSDPERQSLLGHPITRSSSDNSSFENAPYARQRSLLPQSRIRRDKWLTGASTVSFILSFTLIFVGGFYINFDRRKAHRKSGFNVLVKVACSLLFGIVGLVATAAKVPGVSWPWWFVVLLLFAVILLGDGYLLLMLL